MTKLISEPSTDNNDSGKDGNKSEDTLPIRILRTSLKM